MISSAESKSSSATKTITPARWFDESLTPSFDFPESIDQAANDPLIQPAKHDTIDARIQPQILIVQWDDADADAIAALFENRGYMVTSQFGATSQVSDEYGAVVHIARTANLLERKLEPGWHLEGEEWALIARDNIDSMHCLLKLTRHATPALKNYVRNLWALCTVT
jgi:hypothetical protein